MEKMDCTISSRTKWENIYQSYIDRNDKEPRMVCVYVKDKELPIITMHIFSKEQAIREAETLDYYHVKNGCKGSIVMFKDKTFVPTVEKPVLRTSY